MLTLILAFFRQNVFFSRFSSKSDLCTPFQCRTAIVKYHVKDSLILYLTVTVKLELSFTGYVIWFVSLGITSYWFVSLGIAECIE